MKIWTEVIRSCYCFDGNVLSVVRLSWRAGGRESSSMMTCISAAAALALGGPMPRERIPAGTLLLTAGAKIPIPGSR